VLIARSRKSEMGRSSISGYAQVRHIRLLPACQGYSDNQPAGLGRYFSMEKIIGHDGQVVEGLSL
jgi:hypothetical protein